MTTETSKSFVTIYTEATPNPETMKFVANRMILALDSADFPTRESAAENSPLAAKLYEFNFVNGVFIMNNFVTITRKPDIAWDEISPILREYIKAWLEEGRPVVTKVESTFDEFEKVAAESPEKILKEYV